MRLDQLEEHLVKLYLSKQPIIYIETQDEAEVLKIIEESNKNLSSRRTIYTWSATHGVQEGIVPTDQDASTDWIDLLNKATNNKHLATLLVMLDPQKIVDQDPVFPRAVKDMIPHGPRGYSTLVIISDDIQVLPELEQYSKKLVIDYPNEEEIKNTIVSILDKNKIKEDEETINRTAIALKGLSREEVKSNIALALVEGDKKLNPREVARHKCDKINTEALQIITEIPSIEEYGGQEVLKSWLSSKKCVFSKEAREFGLPAPKGMLLVGNPGTGKSLGAKVAAGILDLPLIRFDIGSTMNMYVGETERNMRQILKKIDAISPCTLWIDELDKQFSSGDGQKTHETTKRVLGYFLFWLQEHKTNVFTVATANNIDGLASSYPEFLRKGRWDEIWYITLPNKAEREQIFNIHLRKCKDKKISEASVKKLAKLTRNYTGADIEALINEGMFKAFSQGKKLTKSILEKVIDETPKKPIPKLSKWCIENTRKASITEEIKNESLYDTRDAICV